MPKKPHPADIADRAKIATATHFNVHVRNGSFEKINREAPTLAKAAEIAAQISAQNGGKPCLIYGITPAKMTVLVPKDMIDAARSGTTPAKRQAEKAKRKAKADAPKGGKRAAILEAAQNGKMPAAPDFSAPTHARFRKKLAEIVAMAKAGDIKGLKAMKINPVSTSPKAMARYRDLCIIALNARAAY
ncbi:hypothetical protein [Paenochrobactrum glaciei]|uniref:Uncharacterized protein n=1 Tax=Paenochrobactrum glaciei TaxID=486407 RepID=A0ABN1GBI0_9HYPH